MSETENNTTPVAVACPEVIIPSADDLEEIIIFIGNTYGWEYICLLYTSPSPRD